MIGRGVVSVVSFIIAMNQRRENNMNHFAVVTGASSVIGKALVHLLGRDSYYQL